jgi:hypothetical protein
LQDFQPCVFSYSRHKHTEGEQQQRQEEERQVEGGGVAGSGKATRDLSLEPATRDMSLEGEQHKPDTQPLKQEVEEQPKHVPPGEVG